MKVIVFTMAYNAEKTIERTIGSILGQTFKDFEYYILDNAATDHTGEIIQRYAEIDERVKPIRLNKNDPTNGGALFSLLAVASDADYIVWCDADDTYSPTFLEKMTAFAQENDLDIAACGYDSIDGLSGEMLKHRALTENLIVTGDGFTKQFIQYRGFTCFLWGKLYAIPFLRARASKCIGSATTYHLSMDSDWSLSSFRKAERIGIYGEAMYQYYQYPRSLSNTGVENCLESFQILWRATRDYLAGYGPISKLNTDFLYAIYLSLADEAAGRIFASELNTDKKLEMFCKLFHEPLWAETLAREADPQFRNLAARGEYVQQMKERILALAVTPEQQELAAAAVRELDKPRVC